jgi:hypothetical protein
MFDVPGVFFILPCRVNVSRLVGVYAAMQSSTFNAHLSTIFQFVADSPPTRGVIRKIKEP